MNSVEKVIHENCVLLNVEANDQNDILSKLSDTLYKHGFVKDTFKNAVLEREAQFPTGLPLTSVGVAIPHTDAHHVARTAIGVAILKKPVEFSAMGSPDDKVHASIILMLAMDDGKKQIELLQSLMEFFQKEEKLLALKEMKSEKEIAAYLESQIF
ncbi:PTS sugar transporter subunit IIA [Aeribacillus sp. FSL W8-0870]|jgi:PTS system galactitol-specific IIA component|uniref:PTS sugar transporter subunit IIA n=1 Tax=unclassified Aeribacillus TaxID=2640495 RepID=UPI0030CE853E